MGNWRMSEMVKRLIVLELIGFLLPQVQSLDFIPLGLKNGEELSPLSSDNLTQWNGSLPQVAPIPQGGGGDESTIGTKNGTIVLMLVGGDGDKNGRADWVNNLDAVGSNIVDTDGVKKLVDADGVKLMDAEGVKLMDAEGVKLMDAEGVKLMDADGFKNSSIFSNASLSTATTTLRPISPRLGGLASLYGNVFGQG